MRVKERLEMARSLEREGAEPIDIIAVLKPEWFKEPDICPHMPDDPDVDSCSFCGYEANR